MLQTESKSLKDIIADATLGDAAARERICNEYRPHVVKAAYRGLPTSFKYLTDDVVSDTLIRALQKLPTLQYRDEKQFIGWLCRFAFCICRDKMRAARRNDRLSEQFRENLTGGHITTLFTDAKSAEEEVDPQLVMVGEILESLDYDCRILLVAKLAYGISPAELARSTQELLTRRDKKALPLGSLFARVFDPMAKQMKDRRDFCWKKFSEQLDERDSTQEEGEIRTKKASRSKRGQ